MFQTPPHILKSPIYFGPLSCFPQVCEIELDVSRDQLNDIMEEAGLCFEVEGKAKFQTHPMMNDDWDITCQSFSWEALDCREEKFEVRQL